MSVAGEIDVPLLDVDCWFAGDERSVAFLVDYAFASMLGLDCCGMFPFHYCIPSASTNVIYAFDVVIVVDASTSSYVAPNAIIASLARLAKVATTSAFCAWRCASNDLACSCMVAITSSAASRRSASLLTFRSKCC